MKFDLYSIVFIIACAILLTTSSVDAFVPSTATNRVTTTKTRYDTRQFNFFDNIGSMISNFGKKASVSHILIGPKTLDGPEAKAKLTEIKEMIGDDAEKFGEMAAEYSTCRASKEKGGDLGSFGAGMMVKPFDTVCFNDDVGVVHGPVSTCFGEHLILIRERTGDDE